MFTMTMIDWGNYKGKILPDGVEKGERKIKINEDERKKLVIYQNRGFAPFLLRF